MKAVLEFNLPEDQMEFDDATQGSKMRSVLVEMDQWLRSNTKYAPDTMSQDTYDAFILCRERLREIMLSENVRID
jgi:hypothetical protein